MKDEIKMVLRKHFQAHIEKHAMNVRVMMNNPILWVQLNLNLDISPSTKTSWKHWNIFNE
jgi:hypothetical protein